MNKTYSNTFKKRIAITAKALKEKGESFEFLAKQNGIGKSSIYDWIAALDAGKLDEIDEIKFSEIPDKIGTEILNDMKKSIANINTRINDIERLQKIIDVNMKAILTLFKDGKDMAKVMNLWNEDAE